VILKNLNYCKTSTPSGENNGVDNGDDVGLENNTDLVLYAITEDPKITQKNIANKTSLSTRTISRETKNLRDSGILHGSDLQEL
jgi:predicted HTH transcriptional regulator